MYVCMDVSKYKITKVIILFIGYSFTRVSKRFQINDSERLKLKLIFDERKKRYVMLQKNLKYFTRYSRANSFVCMCVSTNCACVCSSFCTCLCKQL